MHVVINVLRLLHVPCMRDIPFHAYASTLYIVLSNTDLNIFRSLSARIYGWHSVLLLLSSPSELTQIRRTVVLVSSSPSGHRPVCTAGVKLTQWTSSCVYCCCQAHTVDDI